MKPRILLVADVPGWAFDANEHDIAAQLSDSFEFEHHYMGSQGRLPMRWNFDALFLPYWPWIRQFPCNAIAGALRSEWFDTGARQPPNRQHAEFVGHCRVFQVCAERNLAELLALGCRNVVYLTNPVDVARFAPTQIADAVIPCWTGNAQHWSGPHEHDVKGLYAIIYPACSEARVPLRLAEYNTCRLPPEAMPGFYRTANVALCASLFEGASNSVMESMAAGLAVIATDVGNHRSMRDSQVEHLGDSGIMLVERTPQAFAAALAGLTPTRAREMGQINREEIIARWSWEAWREPYRAFFQRAVA